MYGNDRSGKQLDNNHDKWRNKSKWVRVRESDAVSGYISAIPARVLRKSCKLFCSETDQHHIENTVYTNKRSLIKNGKIVNKHIFFWTCDGDSSCHMKTHSP